MSENINNFSLISRLLGNLFYRSPTDPVLDGVFSWLQQKGLAQIWPLETDKASLSAIESLQMSVDPVVLDKEYQRLFRDKKNVVPVEISAYNVDAEAFAAFRQARNMPSVESADHFGLVFLTASWIEDNLASVSAQKELFEQFLLPCANPFLTKVEAAANLPFYRALALLSREILAAMADELEEAE
ncbi:molecular chaperone [Bisgaard Taxon 10/6]|uniref:TorD/DmsD family molecular chaperone n=1 Tax=Exercitatus varius TaxID=67857 RepID=UPI0018A5A23F|nr:molecular chaperone [Exercitatus varius]MDG2915163.1 molecular chaperone [Exercitatus varius]MDG2944326.1 molecular chaperone [Exercitatus varius]MDG2947637.1 molecular chaperone [Exercitatus varius]QOF66784.1 molecular chaperone [Actinobacillus sp. GY-402]